MRLDVPDAARIDARVVQGHGDGLGLAADAGCREAGLVPAIVVDAHALDDRVHRVAIGQGLLQALEHDHATAAGEDGA